jgi:hypothetical protein
MKTGAPERQGFPLHVRDAASACCLRELTPLMHTVQDANRHL